MRLVFLDWLRIFAFSSVLVGHKFMPELVATINAPNLHATPKVILSFLHPMVWGGGAGVVVFFMVSGYIITHVLTQESSVQFLVRRIFRIYPLYITAVFIEQVLNCNFCGQIIWSNVIIQCLLIGDFFEVPYTLSGVEWTLRVEIMFYLFMALKKQIWPSFFREKWFFVLLFLVVFIFSTLPPFPNALFLFKNYFLLYMPFIFLGIGFYLLEKREISSLLFLGFVIFVFYNYWKGIVLYQPNQMSAHFAFLGFVLFTVVWKFRHSFENSEIAIFLSNLTYSVYLFHNWLFDYFTKVGMSKSIALFALLSICYLFHKMIEKPAINFSRKLSRDCKEMVHKNYCFPKGRK